MTEKQERFCLEYLKDQNGRQAAIRAGYSKKTATVIANEILTLPYISEYLNKKLDEAKKKMQLSAESVLDEIRKIAFSDIKNYVNGGNNILELKHLENEKTAAVQSVEVETKTFKDETTINQKIKLYNKLDALEKLAKHLGLYEQDNMQKTKIQIGFADDEDDE